MKPAILILTIILLGCQANSSTIAPSGNNVVMHNIQFVPKTIQIHTGDTVTWTNQDNIDHTVTGFGIDLTVPPGQTISHTFDQLGTFDYRCTIHPGMTGTVIVS